MSKNNVMLNCTLILYFEGFHFHGTVVFECLHLRRIQGSRWGLVQKVQSNMSAVMDDVAV